MKKLIIIAAIGKNLELGKNNDLIWKIKEDMAFFKKNTIGHYVLMGENTFFSLPKLLENRKHLVLSDSDKTFPCGVTVLRSIDAFFEYSKDIEDDIYVIGGASIYKSFIKYADELLLTEIDDENECDVYFPKFEKQKYDKNIIYENNDNIPKFKFVRYIKK